MDSIVRGERRRLTLAEMQSSVGAVAQPSESTGSNKVRASGSEKASSPLGTPSDDVLRRVAKTATRARGTGRNDRKAMRFPPLRLVYAKQRVNAHTGEVVQKARSYYLDVWDYLQEWGFKIFNDLQGEGYGTPTHEQLAALFEARIRERGRTWNVYDGADLGLKDETVETMADHAASAALRDWSADWIIERRAAGRAGGLNSRRGPSVVTPEALEALAALPNGLTRPQQADALGMSLSSLKRLRKQLPAPDSSQVATEPEGIADASS